jgi:hypothetical protein
MAHFTAAELNALDRLPFDEKVEPYYDPLRSSLRWFDEELQGAVGESYEHLLDLVIVRGWIHQGRERESWNALGPTTYFSEMWDEAMNGAPNWPGFKRIKLSEKDRAYFERELSTPLEDQI